MLGQSSHLSLMCRPSIIKRRATFNADGDAPTDDLDATYEPEKQRFVGRDAGAGLARKEV